MFNKRLSVVGYVPIIKLFNIMLYFLYKFI